MRGILQMEDVEDGNFGRQGLDGRSNSPGRSPAARSERGGIENSPPQRINPQFYGSLPQQPPQPLANAISAPTIDPKVRFNDSFQTEKPSGANKAIFESQQKALKHDFDMRFDN